jgi:hypothetical protein
MTTVNIPQELAKIPSIEDMGAIPNPELFSARCDDIFGKGHFDQPLLQKDDGYDLSVIPQQFRGAAKMAIAKHRATPNNQPGCVIRLNQGLLDPGRTFRVEGLHIDAIIRRYPDNIYPKNDIFIVSDTLCTAFQRQAFHLPGHAFQKAEDMGWALGQEFEEQADPAARFVPAPYHMVRYGSYAVHAAQLPTEPTQRTFMMVQFF